MKRYLLIICIALSVVTVTTTPQVYAVENTFQTQLTIGPEDVADPTIPTGLTATAVSSSQINLSWNASTDDIGVEGYRIFRDSAILATTTSLFYSDTGLTASTTYEYTVEAFDAVPKYSGQSAAASSTTFSAPVSPPDDDDNDGGSGSSGSMVLVITNYTAVTTDDSATISFTTNRSTQAKVYWGTTQDYELGSISGLFYNLNHSVKIDSLVSNTVYFVKIVVTDGYGREKSFESSFQTQSSIEESLLTNVTGFRAIPQQNSIALSWNNPTSPVFDSVRIVRSDKFFPRDILDGDIIYEGNAEKYLDSNVSIGKTYYYTIFTRDSNGLYSSGALAQARILPAGEIIISPTSTDPFINIPVLKNVHPQIQELTISDFDFFQSSIKLVNIGTGVVIDGSKNLTISLDYRKVPEILKTIAITLVDPEDPTQVFPFLLRINESKTAYEATLAPLGKSGTYQMKVMILDYKNQGLKRLEGTLKAFIFEQVGVLEEDSTTSRIGIFALFTLIPLLILIAILVRRKKKEDQIIDNEPK
jgi:hypothetical protein